MTPNTLPIYELVINESLESAVEVSYVALVDRPAIDRNFLKFNDQPRLELKFGQVDKERRIVSGPAMFANLPIYRKDEQGKEYFVVFTEATIYAIVQKFFAKNYANNLNLMHSAEEQLDRCTIFESFIVDDARGILPMRGFEDAQNGSWFISVQVNDDDAWQKVTNEEIKGFSVEGIFNFLEPKPVQNSTEEELLAKIFDILNENN